MTLRNRVTPCSTLIADPSRGLVYGNRGCLHDGEGRIRRHHATARWISCRLTFRGWERGPMMQPGRFTELFFLDEATAFAAGHRPCAMCRHDDQRRFRNAWGSIHGGATDVATIDASLHAERYDAAARAHRRHRVPEDLPDGAFVAVGDAAYLVRGAALRRWTPAGYTEHRARRGDEELLTPPTVVEILRQGWEPVVPFLHPSADAP